MIDIQTVFSYLTPISLTIGDIYHIITLRNTRKTQQIALETGQAQLFMPLYDRLREIDYAKIVNEILLHWEWKDYDDFQSKYSPDSNLETYSKIYSMLQYFKGIGVMVKRELIDPTLVDDLLSGFIIRCWEKMEPIIRIDRERMNWPQYAEHVEYLYNIIRPIVEEKHPEPRK